MDLNMLNVNIYLVASDKWVIIIAPSSICYISKISAFISMLQTS